MDRRTFLTAVGAGLIAGCSQNQSDTEETPQPSPTSMSTPPATATSTPPQPTPTSTPTPTVAAFEIASVTTPNQVPIGEEYAVEIAIRNTGGVEGTFRSAIEIRTPDSLGWTNAGEVAVTVPAGATRTWTGTFTYDYLNRYTFRLAETGTRWVVETVSKQLPFEDPYVTPQDVSVVVNRLQLQTQYSYRTDPMGDTRRVNAPRGRQFAFVFVGVRNTSNQPIPAPLSRSFVVVAGDTQYTEADIDKELQRYRSTTLQPGASRNGWIAYELPRSLTVDDLQVVWSDRSIRGPIAVYWHPE